MSEPVEQPDELDLRQVLVARHDLGMRKGKIAAQAAHASMAALLRGPGAGIRAGADGAAEFVIPLDADLHAWLTGRFKKICVYVKSEAELLELHQKAQQAGLRCALITDAGLTEFGGVPTHTVLAIGPHPKATLQPLTGHLPLY